MYPIDTDTRGIEHLVSVLIERTEPGLPDWIILIQTAHFWIILSRLDYDFLFGFLDFLPLAVAVDKFKKKYEKPQFLAHHHQAPV